MASLTVVRSLCRSVELSAAAVGLVRRERTTCGFGAAACRPSSQPRRRPGEPLFPFFFFFFPCPSSGSALTTHSSSCVAAVPGSSADRGGAEAADPGGRVAAQQPPPHQGRVHRCSQAAAFLCQVHAADFEPNFIHRPRSEF